MKHVLGHELARPLALALIILGIALIGFAVFRYAQTSYQIGQNFAFQQQAQAGEVAVQNEAEARVLMAADIELRELVSERNNMVIVGGGGLVIVALGWLLADLVSQYAKKRGNSSFA